MSKPNVTDEQIKRFFDKLLDGPTTKYQGIAIERNDHSIVVDVNVQYTKKGESTWQPAKKETFELTAFDIGSTCKLRDKDVKLYIQWLYACGCLDFLTRKNPFVPDNDG